MLAYESCDQMSLNNEKTVSKISVNFLNVPFEKSQDPECKQKLFRTPPFLCLSCTVRILIYYFQCGPPLHIQHIPLQSISHGVMVLVISICHTYTDHPQLLRARSDSTHNTLYTVHTVHTVHLLKGLIMLKCIRCADATELQCSRTIITA